MEIQKDTLVETENPKEEEDIARVPPVALDEKVEKQKALPRARWKRWYNKNREKYNKMRKEKQKEKKLKKQKERSRADSEFSNSSEESTESSSVVNSPIAAPYLTFSAPHPRTPFHPPATSSSASDLAAEDPIYLTQEDTPYLFSTSNPFSLLSLRGVHGEMSSQNFTPHPIVYVQDQLPWISNQTRSVDDEPPNPTLRPYPPIPFPLLGLSNAPSNLRLIPPIPSFPYPQYSYSPIVSNPVAFHMIGSQPPFFDNHYQDPIFSFPPSQTSFVPTIPPGLHFPKLDRSFSLTNNSLHPQNRSSKKRTFDEL